MKIVRLLILFIGILLPVGILYAEWNSTSAPTMFWTAISCTSDSLCVATTSTGAMYTSDWGNTWNVSSWITWVWYLWQDILSCNWSGWCIAISWSSRWYSIDWGISWTSISPPWWVTILGWWVYCWDSWVCLTVWQVWSTYYSCKYNISSPSWAWCVWWTSNYILSHWISSDWILILRGTVAWLQRSLDAWSTWTNISGVQPILSLFGSNSLQLWITTWYSTIRYSTDWSFTFGTWSIYPRQSSQWSCTLQACHVRAIGGAMLSTDNWATWTSNDAWLDWTTSSISSWLYNTYATSASGWIFKFSDTTPPEPLSTSINWLSCTTDWIPSLSWATWYDFGELPNMFDWSTADKIAWANYSSDYSNFDTIVWEPSWSGSSMWSGTFQYPATQTGYLYDWDEIGTLWITSTRDWIPTDFNLFQFFGTQNIAFGLAGRALLNDTNWVQYGYIQLTSSWWVITGWLANTNSAIKTLWVQLMTRFRWFRIGKGQLEQKTSCSINFNQCQWSFEGNNLACVPVSTVSGLQFEGNGAWCWVTGSWSIYWSGACVPLTNASGAIIPPPPITGWFVTYDWYGNVVWTVAPTIDPESEFWDLWTCWDDPWYKCPITIIRKLWNYTFTSASKAQNTVNQLEQATTQSMSWTIAGASTTGATYTWWNILIEWLVSVDDRVWENGPVNTAKWIAIFVVLFCFSLWIVLIIKS